MIESLNQLKQSLFKNNGSNFELLGLPGAIDRGNLTIIAIDKIQGPKFVFKICREKKIKKFYNEFSLVNELYNFNKYFSMSIPKPISNSFINDHDVMVSEYVKGDMLLPKIDRQHLPKIKLVKKHFSLVGSFLNNFYDFLRTKKLITHHSVVVKSKIDSLKKYFNFNENEISFIESKLSGTFLHSKQHGDFTRHNILKRGESIAVIDWTDTSVKIITDDLFYFIINYYLQIRIKTGLNGLLDSFDNTFFVKNKYSNHVKKLRNNLLSKLGLDYSESKKYLILFLINRCIEEAIVIEKKDHLTNFSINLLSEIKSKNKFDSIIWYHFLKFLIKKENDQSK